MPLNLNDADKIKELIVEPMVNALRAEMAPLLAVKQNHEDRIAKLESGKNERIDKLEANQKKGLWGWGVFASAVAIGVGSLWGWVKSVVSVKIGH